MITSSYPRNTADGAGSFVASLARTLVALGHDVHVVAPWDAQVIEIDQGGVQVHRFRYAPGDDMHVMGHGRSLKADRSLKWAAPLLMPSFCAAAYATALAQHRANPFDVIHGHWAVPGGPIASAVARATRTPLVQSLHGSDVFVIERNGLYAAAARRAFARAKQVMACSADLLNRTRQVGLAENKSQVVPYGVDSTRFCPGEGTSLRQELGIPTKAPIIGAVGRLVHKKGFEYLMDALPAIRQAHPDVWCVIGGEGDLMQPLRQRITALGMQGRCLLPGNISWAQIPTFYRMCDILAVPSVIDETGNVDGLPNVLLESMACGCAVVASRVAGIPDTISHLENGWLVEPANPQALSDACSALLNDRPLREKLGQAARTLMQTHYTWHGIAQRHVAIYENAISVQHSATLN